MDDLNTTMPPTSAPADDTTTVPPVEQLLYHLLAQKLVA